MMRRWNQWSKRLTAAVLAAAMTVPMCMYASAEEIPADVVLEAAPEAEVWDAAELPYVEEAAPAVYEEPAAEVPVEIVPEVPSEPQAEVPAEVVPEVPAEPQAEIPSEVPADAPAEILPADQAEIPSEVPADAPAEILPADQTDPQTEFLPEETPEPTAEPLPEVVIEPDTATVVEGRDPATEAVPSVQPEAGTVVEDQSAAEPENAAVVPIPAGSDEYDVEGVSNSELESYLSEIGMGEWVSSIDDGSSGNQGYTWGLNTLTREPAELKYYSFAIFGLSGENSGDDGRSDTIIICTIDPEHKEIKLTSILRDTKAAIDGHEPQKINAAHKIGGPELAVETLNKNFGLTLKDYITVNFETLIDIVDTVGGIDLELTQEEADFINEYSTLYGFPALTEGMQHLNGWQSVLYCRIRKIDSDKVRAGRQQTVIRKIFEKLDGAGFLQWMEITLKVLGSTTISMPLGNILEVIRLPLGEYTLVNNIIPDIEYETELKTAIDEHGEWVWLYDLGKAGDRIVDIINNQ